LAAGVIENTVAKLDVDPANLMAWLGPAISQPSFEVGDEVKAAFLAHDANAGACFEANARGRWQADLNGLARQRLAAAGVMESYGGEFCTFLDADRFYSYRRDPDCGRLVSFVGLRAP
jgi:copper oxidase (laccase) domain-containing protein